MLLNKELEPFRTYTLSMLACTLCCCWWDILLPIYFSDNGKECVIHSPTVLHAEESSAYRKSTKK